MTTELRLRINKYLEDTDSPPKIFAKIYPVETRKGKATITGAPREELVPISHHARHKKTITLKPGRYIVEAVLPSGEMLSDEVSLKGNEKKDLVFDAKDSPREWLSWQHLMGNVATKPAIKPRVKRRVAKKGSPKWKGGNGFPGVTRRLPRRTKVEAPKVKMDRPLEFLVNSPAPLRGESKQNEMWSWLAQLRASTPAALIRLLNANEPPRKVSPYDHDDNFSVFRVSQRPSPPQSHINPTPLGEHQGLRRYFVALPTRNSIELLSLPMPWGINDKPIEVVVQEPTDKSGFWSSMSVIDNQFGMLLGYLSSGAMPTAREFAGTARGLLFEKVENPYAAAAGGYALVGTALHASDRSWHRWIRNLMNRFNTIPDGAIQYGQLKLRMHRNSKDFKEARDAFKLAFNRGLPFYSLGMRWLVDGLEAISRDDTEAKEMLDLVRPISWITNYQQAFTILKLNTHRNV